MQAIYSSLLLSLLPFAYTSEASFVFSFSGTHAVLILLVSCNNNEIHKNRDMSQTKQSEEPI
jgi:hypothetical protein